MQLVPESGCLAAFLFSYTPIELASYNSEKYSKHSHHRIVGGYRQ
jgi:hypothetical protein